MIKYHGWSKDRAALEMDMRRGEMMWHVAENLGFKHIVEIIQDRQKVEVISPAVREEAEELIFGKTPGMESDVNAEPEKEEESNDEKKELSGS
jgi:hypothetical protein